VKDSDLIATTDITIMGGIIFATFYVLRKSFVVWYGLENVLSKSRLDSTPSVALEGG